MGDMINYLIDLEQNWVNYYKCLILLELSNFYSGYIDENDMLTSCGIPVSNIIEEKAEKLSSIKDKIPMTFLNKITASDVYNYFNSKQRSICDKIRKDIDRDFDYERQPANSIIAVKQLINEVGEQMKNPEIRAGKEYHVYMLVFRDLVSRAKYSYCN